MNRVVLIDGVEGSGKTFLVNKLKKEYPHWKFIKCPAESIIKKYFNQMMSDDIRSCSVYISALIADIKETLKHYSDETIVFDRGWLSTLVYQGKNKKIIEMINDKYQYLFRCLDVDYSDSCAILMCDPVIGHTREDKSDCPEKNELANIPGKDKRFRHFAYNKAQLLPVYEFSYNKTKPTWMDVNDIAGEVFDVA